MFRKLFASSPVVPDVLVQRKNLLLEPTLETIQQSNNPDQKKKRKKKHGKTFVARSWRLRAIAADAVGSDEEMGKGWESNTGTPSQNFQDPHHSPSTLKRRYKAGAVGIRGWGLKFSQWPAGCARVTPTGKTNKTREM